jgi:SAM-dependent methyltransferase
LSTTGENIELAEQYDAYYPSNLVREKLPEAIQDGWPRDRFQAIVAFAGKGESVLDVGCGNAVLLYQLRQRFSRLVGLEYSGHRLDQAKLNMVGLPFTAVQGSAESMPSIPDNSIECIITADTIEHIPDVFAAAGELFRVLKPGGRMVMNTPNIASARRRLRLLMGRFPSTSQPNEGFGNEVLFDGGHLHYFTFRSLSMLLERAGFTIEQRVGYGSFGKLHDLYAPLLSGGVQLIARKPS